MSLYVKPISALLTHDTELFSNMDPYVVIVVGGDKKRSATHKEGGKKPKWNEVFVFHPKVMSMQITVFDQDTFTDDTVGAATVDLNKYVNDPQEHKEYIGLTYKGKSAGKIYMSIRYQQEGAMNSGQSQGGWGNTQGSNWGQPQSAGWGQVQANNSSGWGTNNHNGWGSNNPPQSQQAPQPQGWGQQPQPYSGWGSNQQQQANNTSGWGPNNNGWGQNNDGLGNQQQPQNNGWGQANHNGWGQTNNGWGQPNNGWGDAQQQQPQQQQPPQQQQQQQQPDLMGLLAGVLNNKPKSESKPPENNPSGWGPNNNGWGNNGQGTGGW